MYLVGSRACCLACSLACPLTAATASRACPLAWRLAVAVGEAAGRSQRLGAGACSGLGSDVSMRGGSCQRMQPHVQLQQRCSCGAACADSAWTPAQAQACRAGRVAWRGRWRWGLVDSGICARQYVSPATRLQGLCQAAAEQGAAQQAPVRRTFAAADHAAGAKGQGGRKHLEGAEAVGAGISQRLRQAVCQHLLQTLPGRRRAGVSSPEPVS